MEALKEVLQNLDWSPLWISLKTGVVATVIAFFFGILIAGKMMYSGKTTRSILDGILTLPLVLPPTVMGFFLLLLFSKRRPFGIFLYQNFGIKVVQSWLGCVIAAVVIALPLMYRNARSAFEQVDINLVHAARTLGMSDTKLFFRVVLPSAKPGVLSGTILTFARAMGEYGATSMLAGNIPGKTATISQRVAMVMQDQDYLTAGVWVFVIVVISFGIVFLLNYVILRKDRSMKRW